LQRSVGQLPPRFFCHSAEDTETAQYLLTTKHVVRPVFADKRTRTALVVV